MPYYPKSQIKTNLYTNGTQFQTTQGNYSGPYYEVSNGKKFTGKFPGDEPNLPLTPQDPELFEVQDNSGVLPQQLNPYYPDPNFIVRNNEISNQNYNFSPNKRLTPQFYTPMLTQQEKDQGYLTRYFCKKGNEYKYIEISKENFNKLQSRSNDIAWDLYTPLSIKWLIKGNKEEVFKSNKGTVAFEEENKKWYGFSQYLKNNFTKYYLES